MKNIKFYFAVLFSVFILAVGSTAKAEGGIPPTTSQLRIQLFNEFKDALSEPVTLFFSDKNLFGQAFVTFEVEKNGKISLRSVIGENNMLNKMLEIRMKEKNLWTDSKFNGNEFTFKVMCKGNCKVN